jgi:hypothetical protein
MARKTFISYKYSEAQNVRDRIIKALGSDAAYYQGETADSPDISDTSADNIKKNLKDMIYDTSITIVVVSPDVKKSKWIDWEIEYSLKEITRQDKTSRTNGVVGVIMKIDGGYDWLINSKRGDDNCSIRTIDEKLLYPIINKNRYNLNEQVYSCSHCKTLDMLSSSYISLIEEDSFIQNTDEYIENAYEKSKIIDTFNIVKTR